jgi:hypothetical protein
MDEAKEVDAHTGVVTITRTITGVTLVSFFHVLKS